jgi:hypothetical protein
MGAAEEKRAHSRLAISRPRHEAIGRFFELGLSIPEVSLISGHRDVWMLQWRVTGDLDAATQDRHLLDEARHQDLPERGGRGRRESLLRYRTSRLLARCRFNVGGQSMSQEQADRLEIRDLIENWAVWRDAGDWQRLRSVWHDDGRMMATWFQGSADEFIVVSRKAFEAGISILHFLGGVSIDLRGHRAIAQTKMTINQRALVDGVECDVVCTGRFYDFMGKRNGRWGLVLRQPIYEKDRIDPVDPARFPNLDRARLESFPIGYRHLAYLQEGLGFRVKRDMPGLFGDAVEELYARGAARISG